MSMIYRLELTEQEKEFVLKAMLDDARECDRLPFCDGSFSEMCVDIADKLRALEPVGTEGT